MGGYAFDLSKDTKPRIWPQQYNRLTPNAIAVLGCLISQDKSLRGVVPFLSEEEIWDKSKANGLAKAIGLDPEETKARIWASSDPPVFALKGAEPIPSTSSKVSCEWHSIDVDEILLERLRVVEKLRTLADCVAYDKAFSHVLDTACMLKPRELNFTDSLMRQNYDVSPVGRNLIGASGIILSGILDGGLHTIAWGSTAFTSPVEDLAWKVFCFVVAAGGLFTFAGIFGLDMATKRQQANLRMDIMKGWYTSLRQYILLSPFSVSLAGCIWYLKCSGTFRFSTLESIRPLM
ncbi:MAG: hypothetical protein Q9201_001388 [Fulgogasparrea decipioides]